MEYTGKYRPLMEYLKSSKKDEETLTYEDIKLILKFDLPNSAYRHREWWSNGGHDHSNSWLDAGWSVNKLELQNKVTFKKNNSKQNVFEDGNIELEEIGIGGNMNFKDEKELVEYIYSLLLSQFNNNIIIEKEGSLNYKLPNNTNLSHKSDILMKKNERLVSIEIKYKSSVTDQFKCRSYDILHLKKDYGSKLLGVLIFVKVKGNGISIEQAKNISYPFDFFIGINIEEIEKKDWFFDLINKINEFIIK